MRLIWRLVLLGATMVGYTLYASLAVRWRSPDERPAFRARRQQVGCGLLCRILKLRVTRRGASLPERPMLYVCNHLGLVDALLIASQMPVAFAAKAEMRSWPLLGWVGRTMGIIFVERERPTRTSVFVRAVQERLRHGVSVVVFPEGTTGWGDAVRRFKTGAFEAVAEEVRGGVLPLYLKVKAVEGQPAGNRALAWVDESLPANAWRLLGLKHVDVELWVGTPLATAGRDRKELARRAHAAVSRLASAAPEADGPDVHREHPASPPTRRRAEHEA